MINEVLKGLGVHVPTALPQGFLGFDGSLPKYTLDLEKAENYFRRAFRGEDYGSRDLKWMFSTI